MDAVARYGHAPLLNRRDIGITGIREDNGGVGPVHDYLQVDVALAKNCGVMLGRDLHRHEDRHRARVTSTPIVLNKNIMIREALKQNKKTKKLKNFTLGGGG